MVNVLYLIVLFETLALLVALAVLAIGLNHHNEVVKDLMDRLMARDYSDYATHSPAARTPLRRWSTSDAVAAKIAKKKEFDKGPMPQALKDAEARA